MSTNQTTNTSNSLDANSFQNLITQNHHHVIKNPINPLPKNNNPTPKHPPSTKKSSSTLKKSEVPITKVVAQNKSVPKTIGVDLSTHHLSQKRIKLAKKLFEVGSAKSFYPRMDYIIKHEVPDEVIDKGLEFFSAVAPSHEIIHFIKYKKDDLPTNPKEMSFNDFKKMLVERLKISADDPLTSTICQEDIVVQISTNVKKFCESSTIQVNQVGYITNLFKKQDEIDQSYERIKYYLRGKFYHNLCVKHCRSINKGFCVMELIKYLNTQNANDFSKSSLYEWIKWYKLITNCPFILHSKELCYTMLQRRSVQILKVNEKDDPEFYNIIRKTSKEFKTTNGSIVLEEIVSSSVEHITEEAEEVGEEAMKDDDI